MEVYARMAALPGLNAAEQSFLRRRLSDARGALGLHLIGEGQLAAGRAQLGLAFSECRRLGSLAKVVVAHLPGRLRNGLMQSLFPRAAA